MRAMPDVKDIKNRRNEISISVNTIAMLNGFSQVTVKSYADRNYSHSEGPPVYGMMHEYSTQDDDPAF